MQEVLKIFNNHPSVEKIRRNIKINEKFSFQQVTEDLVWKTVVNLDRFKATPVGDIPTDILKSPVDMHFPFVTKITNLPFESNCFTYNLKLVEVSPVFKKNNDLEKENYRPVSVLSHTSKVFERIEHNQIDNFKKDELSNSLTGFRKNHSSHHCLMWMLEMWKDILDKGYLILKIMGSS